ncbi:DISC1 [Branchiostoma lanceolatum]|uniref:DISC1 protein n=1 Tax=Branchiostoma lanceolatum TaxID=7740 RepID=A0A8J9ZT07_BRALA|nr:DISC1 [Branchiostoma lanceolatum]
MALFQGMKVGRVAQEGDEGGGKSLFSFITSNASAPPVDQFSESSITETTTTTTTSSVVSSSDSVGTISKVPVTSPPYTFPSGLSASGTTSGYSSESSSTASSPRALIFPARTGDASSSGASVVKVAASATKSTRKKRHGSLIRPGYARQDTSTEGSKTDLGAHDSPTSNSKSTLREEPEESTNNLDKSASVDRTSPENSKVPCQKLSTEERSDALRPDSRTSSSGDLPKDCQPARQDTAILNNQTKIEENLKEEKSSSTNPFESLTLDVADGEHVGEKTAVSGLESLSLDLSFDLDFDLDLDVTVPDSTGKSEAMKAENAAVVDGLPEETDTRDLQVVNLGSGDGESSSSDVTSRKDDDLVMTDSRIEDVQESSRLDEVRERFYSLQERHQSLLQTRVRLCCRQVKKRQELSRIKTEQDLAVKNEDYDKAEAFNRQLQSLTADLQVMTFDLPSSEPSLASLLEEMRHAMEEEVAMATEEAERYTAMKAREELCLKELKMTKQVELNREKQKLTTLQDQLAMAASHLSLDREHLQKSKAQLSSQVEERTAEFHSAKEQLVERRQDIQEEISALEEKLWVLRQEEEAVSAEIQLQEDGISRVEQQFSAERAQLEEERRTIDRKQGELEEQAREASREEQSLRDREAELQGEEERLQDSLQSIQERASHMTCQAQELSIRAEDMSALPVCTGVITTDNKQLTRLKEQQQERQREVQELTTQVLRFQTRVTDLNKQLGETTAQVPVLQEAKQLAVAGYNFSEAKRLADEIKDLEDKRVSKEEELVKARGDVKQLTQDLETSKKVLKEVQEELKQKEEEHDTARKDEAYRLYQELQLQLERCTNNIIRSVLQADMTACQLWIQDICEKHHLPLPQELQALDLHSILGEEDDIMVAMDTSCVRENGMSKAASSEETPTGAAGGSSTAEDCMQACDAADSSCPAEDYVQACEAISMRLLELEDQLQEAVGQEDYDAAQTLHEEIQSLKHQLQNMLVSLQQHDL